MIRTKKKNKIGFIIQIGSVTFLIFSVFQNQPLNENHTCPSHTTYTKEARQYNGLETVEKFRLHYIDNLS